MYSASVSFDVAAEAYDRFMGRYSRLLSPQLADLAGVRGRQRVLDVGCGPGALTAELVTRLGPGAVAAVDPSESFVAAARARNPGVDVLQASAEHLPFPDRAFDARSPSSSFTSCRIRWPAWPRWRASPGARVSSPRASGITAAARARSACSGRQRVELDPEVDDESDLAGVREGQLAELFEAAGLRDVEATVLSVSLEHPTFEEWWEPFTRGVGPAGAYVATLDAERQAELRQTCRSLLPTHRSCSRLRPGRLGDLRRIGPRDSAAGGLPRAGHPPPRL